MKKTFYIKITAMLISVSLCFLASCARIHQHTYIPTVTNPTCEEQGFTTFACECGINYVSDYRDELPHTYGENGTCTSCGVYNYEPAFKYENGVITGLTDFGKTLKDFVIPRTINGEKINAIKESAFEYCWNIESVVIPRTLTIIGPSAFRSCINLKSIIIPATVSVIGNYAFRDCSALNIYYEKETYPNGWGEFWNSTNCYIVRGYKYVTKGGIVYGIKNGVAEVVKQPTSITSANVLSSVEHKGTTYSVTAISKYAFYKCEWLESVTIPNTVTSIGLNAFNRCSSLEEVVIPSTVTVIEESAFSSCDLLTIKCATSSKPSDWSELWNYSNIPVVWGYAQT